MKRSSDLDHFCQGLAGLGLSETEKAVALLWCADHFCLGVEKPARELAEELHDTGLTGRVNVSRLARNLSKSRSTVRGKRPETFKIALVRRLKLDERYRSLLKRRSPTVSDALLPDDVVKGTRQYLEDLARQVNGCYDYGFYDGCAVMCRRMVETLLISAFEKAGHLAAIEDSNGNLVGLDEMIKVARSGKFIRLGRTSGGTLEKVKEIGHTAAHDRYHIARDQDIAEFRSGFRKVVSELLALAGIAAKS